MLGKIESGVVTMSVGDRGAFAVEETIYLPDGRSFPKSYTVWASEAPAKGTIVQVTGEVTIKLREYAAPSGMKTAIDVNFNNPNVIVMGQHVIVMGQPKPETEVATAEAIQNIADGLEAKLAEEPTF